MGFFFLPEAILGSVGIGGRKFSHIRAIHGVWGKLTPLRLFLAKIWEVVFGDIEPGAELKFLKTPRRKKSVQIQNRKWDIIPTPTNYYTRPTCRL